MSNAAWPYLSLYVPCTVAVWEAPPVVILLKSPTSRWAEESRKRLDTLEQIEVWTVWIFDFGWSFCKYVENHGKPVPRIQWQSCCVGIWMLELSWVYAYEMNAISSPWKLAANIQGSFGKGTCSKAAGCARARRGATLSLRSQEFLQTGYLQNFIISYMLVPNLYKATQF